MAPAPRYVCELDPQYLDVILDHYSTAHNSGRLCRKRRDCRREIRLYRLHIQVCAEFPAEVRNITFLKRPSRCLPDIQTTPQILGPLLTRSRNFVLIQNGIGIELDLQRAAPEAVVMSGCAWIDATIVDHGRTLKHGPLVRQLNTHLGYLRT